MKKDKCFNCPFLIEKDFNTTYQKAKRCKIHRLTTKYLFCEKRKMRIAKISYCNKRRNINA